MREIRRRDVVQGIAALPVAAPAIVSGRSGHAAVLRGEPIVLGMPISRTAAAGVQDHQDHLNGTILAQEEINAVGGILGRPLEIKHVDVDLLSAESCQASIRRLVDMKVHAISQAFLFVPIPAMDASVGYKCPYVSANTQRAATEMVAANPDKYSHIFQMDPSEVYYGLNFPNFLQDMQESGAWKPTNNGVHIIQEQVAYCQTISKAAQESLSKSKFELAAVTDIQYPVQDWAPVIQQIRKVGAGTVMVDHWVAAEYASFVKQFRANPLKGALVYLQYGPSQPEFLELSGRAAEGFVWSTVLGVYADEKGMRFRNAYRKRFPDTPVGLAHTASGYDIAYMFKQAWEAVGDPNNFKAVCDYLRVTPFRGIAGWSYMNNARQEALHYPLGTPDIEKGMAHLYFQVQGGQHKIIYPRPLKETTLRPAAWM